MTDATRKQRLQVRRVWAETPRILGIELQHPLEEALPAFEAGAHLSFYLPNGMIRQYSLAGDPKERDHYRLGVQRDPNSRGGSIWMHENVVPGATLETSLPMNNFPLGLGAERYILIAGGVGITPLMSMLETLNAEGKAYHLYYCTREPEDAAFRDRLGALGASGNVEFVCDGGDPSKGLQIKDLLSEYRDGTELYCCGPSGLMSAVNDAAAHWPANTVHFEWFVPSADPTIDHEQGQGAFTVVIQSTGDEFSVGPDESLLEVLNANGLEVDSVCQEGVCGTCIVGVLEGEIAHRDHILDDDEKATNSVMTACCSRAVSEKLVLDL